MLTSASVALPLASMTLHCPGSSPVLFFFGGECILYFCFFHLVSFMYTFLSTSAWTVEIPRLGLGLSHDS